MRRLFARSQDREALFNRANPSPCGFSARFGRDRRFGLNGRLRHHSGLLSRVMLNLPHWDSKQE